MRDIKIQVIFNIHGRDFKPEIKHHYTTVNRLCNKQDSLDYESVEVIAKRQFIGIYDFEHNEIYHGDIIVDHVGLGVVVWCDENCSFKVSYRGKDTGQGKWFRDYTPNELKTILVIGNKFERPELLEQ